MYEITFISEADFEKNVLDAINIYNATLQDMNLAMFNSNIIDPIKLLFDKEVYHNDFESVINFEVLRQKDKTNTNAIGYFHQNMFKYINGCSVPKEGWDVIVEKSKYKICVEMKNKHNTMNSSAAQRTYIRMLNHVANNKRDFCYLVEVISKKSQSIVWSPIVDNKTIKNNHIKRVSIDQFYKEVTGVDDAFFQICMQLPKTIRKLIRDKNVIVNNNNKLFDEIKGVNSDYLFAFYLLAFKSYEGFDQLGNH